MTVSVEVPWECTCCVPACGTSGQLLVKELTRLEYLQIYWADSVTVDVEVTAGSIAEKITFTDPGSFPGLITSEVTLLNAPTGSDSWTPSKVGSTRCTRYFGGDLYFQRSLFENRTTPPPLTINPYQTGNWPWGAQLILASGPSPALHVLANITLSTASNGFGANADFDTGSDAGTSVGGAKTLSVFGETVTGFQRNNTLLYSAWSSLGTYDNTYAVAVEIDIDLATPP
jgi:hypothetical protein